MLNVLALPFLFRSIDHLYKVIDGPIGDEILGRDRAERASIGLTFYDSGARSIYTARRPVQAIDRSRRPAHARAAIRADGKNDQGARRRRRSSLPYGQVLTALSTNLVDGAENNWPSYVSTGHYKIAHFYTLTEHTMGPEMVIMHRRAWARSLARGSRRSSARRRASRATTCASNGRTGSERSRKQANEAGVTVIGTVDRKPFEDATTPLRDELRADPKFRPLIDRIEAVR